MQKADLLLIGLGDLGAVTLELLAREQSVGKILVGSRNVERGVARCNLARIGPMFQILFTDQPAIRDYRAFCKFVDRSRFQKFALALLEKGVYISPSAALHSIASLAHTAEEVDVTLNAVRKVLDDSS